MIRVKKFSKKRPGEYCSLKMRVRDNVKYIKFKYSFFLFDTAIISFRNMVTILR